MREKDNEFSIDAILKAAQENTSDAADPASTPLQRPAGTHSRAPHALTPEEVVSGFASDREAPRPVQPSAPQFVVFETDIDPETVERQPAVPRPTGEKEAAAPRSSLVHATKAWTGEETAEAPQPAPAGKEAGKADGKAAFAPGRLSDGESLYERMKKIQAARTEAEHPAPSPAHAAEAVPAAPIHTAAPARPVTVRVPPVKAGAGSKKASGASAQSAAADAPKSPAAPPAAGPKSASALQGRQKLPVRPAAMSVEELIRYAEQKAERETEEKYGPRTLPAGMKPASYFEKKFEEPDAAPSVLKKEEEAPASPAEAVPEYTASFAPIPRPMEESEPESDGATVVSKTPDISSDSREGHSLADQSPEVTSFSSGVFSRQTLKVTPVKRSRMFITPTTPGTATPATRVLAKEHPIDVDLVDPAAVERENDEAGKQPAPYASQYSLADSDLNGQVFVKEKAKAPRPGEDVDIVSSAAALDALEGKTVPFDTLNPSPDLSDLEDILPPEPQEAAADTQPRKFRLFGEDEPEAAAEELPPAGDVMPEETLLSDYETPADRETIEADLSARAVRLTARLIPTVLLCALLFLLSTPLFDGLRMGNSILFSVIYLLLLAGVAAVNLPVMRGMIALVTLRPDGDSLAALAVTAGLIQGIVAAAAGGEAVGLMGALGGLALIFNLIGKLMTVRTIRANFRVVANNRPKSSAFLLDREEVTSLLASGAVLGEALIFSARRINRPTDFLKTAYRREPYERLVPKVTLLGLILAIGGGAAGWILQGQAIGLTVFAAVLCACCPPAAALLSALPMRLASKRLTPLGAEVADYRSAENFSYANAATLHVADLFPQGTVKLFNMHILSPHPIDQSILEAAAILNKIGSPLAQIFDDMITPGIPLPEVDTIVYENQMGVSGWLGEKRIFIGNRTLMETHAIPLPSLDVDKRILRSGYFPVYLASTEGPAALFIVGYEADEEISYQLRRLTATGVTLLVDTCDQNIGEEMICDYFELYPDSVRVLSPQNSKLYRKETAPEEAGSAAALVCGDAAGSAALLTACIRLKEGYTASLALHIIGMLLTLALIFGAVFTGNASLVTALLLGGAQLLWSLVVGLVSLIRRP